MFLVNLTGLKHYFDFGIAIRLNCTSIRSDAVSLQDKTRSPSWKKYLCGAVVLILKATLRSVGLLSLRLESDTLNF